MKKILIFIDSWGIRIITILTLVVFFKTCNTNSKIIESSEKIKTLSETLISTNKKMDSLVIQLKKEIRKEGLKVEKRMIQSTDRTLLDVHRQSEIDKELTALDF